ncbi:MAG: (Fe-S)-binding protein [Thaumarchaeota archaeon]|nr:(Fe-S)-binding protein [Nitrososphaerota archaeon]
MDEDSLDTSPNYSGCVIKMGLEELRDEVEKCVGCRVCEEACTFYSATHDEKFSPLTKIEIARKVLNGGRIEDDDIPSIYACTQCRICERACPFHLPIADIVRKMREILVREKRVPEPIMKLCGNIIEHGSMTGQGVEYWRSWIPKDEEFPSKAEYLYLVGCMIPFRLHGIGDSTVKIFKKAGLDFTILGENERCCGLLLYDHGFIEEAKKTAERNVAKIRETGARKVVTACAACYKMYKYVYHELLGDLGFEVLHVVDVLYSLLEKGVIKPRKRIEAKVAYLDPCHYTKLEGKFSKPRKVLESIPGLELVELSRTMELGYCCGLSGGVGMYLRDLPGKAAMKIIEDALEKGAEKIITSCPLCMYQLSRTIRRNQVEGIEAVDLPIILWESLGE